MSYKLSILKTLTIIIATLVMAIGFGAVLMISVYNLPTDSMQKNVQSSLKIYEIEKDRYAWAPAIISSQMDNWTDSEMLNISAHKKGSSFEETVYSAMLNPRYYISGGKYKSDNLKIYNFSKSEKTIHTYGRYWHGYAVFLKPLLMFFTMSDIRVLNMFFQLLLCFLLLIHLYKVGGYRLSLPFLVAIAIFNPISSAMCMQYATMYYITLISSFILLKWKLYQSKMYWYFFLCLGICTSFLDFLTYPITALGCNLIFFVIFNKEEVFSKLKKVIISSCTWSVGYIGMWGGKWLIGYLLTGNNILNDAIDKIKERTGGEKLGYDISISNAFSSTIEAFNNHISSAILGMGILLLVYLYVSNKYKFKANISIILPLLCISVYPFIWFIMVKNHSIIHWWMTHKNYMLTIVSILYLLVYSIEKKDTGEKIINYRKIITRFIIALVIMCIGYYSVKYLIPIRARVDISSKHTENAVFLVYTENSDTPEKECEWMPKYGNRGVVVQQNGHKMTFSIKALQNANLVITLRGPNKIDSYGKRNKIWVKYTSFKIDGKSVMQGNKKVWHDKPYRYNLKVQKGNTYKVKLKWRKK